MLKATLAVIAVVGLLYGFWEAFSEQRRLSGMARACEAGRGRQ